jgi:hypothetical protein
MEIVVPAAVEVATVGEELDRVFGIVIAIQQSQGYFGR